MIDGTGPQKQRGSSDQHAPVALLSKSGREVYVGLHQSNRGFLLVYDVDSKQLLDVYKVMLKAGAARRSICCGSWGS